MNSYVAERYGKGAVTIAFASVLLLAVGIGTVITDGAAERIFQTSAPVALVVGAAALFTSFKVWSARQKATAR